MENLSSTIRMTAREVVWLALIVLLGVAFLLFKADKNLLDYNSDYVGFVDTAMLFSAEGEMPVDPNPARILKPLAPALIALGAPVVGFEDAFLWHVALAYIALVFVTYLFFKLFFNGNVIQALVGTVFFSLSYPMLRYGLDLYSETGALLFYVAGLLGVLMFLRKPSYETLLLNVVIAIFGFLWKEYSAVHCVIFNLIIMVWPTEHISISKKLRFLLLFNGLWILAEGLWQLAVWNDYGYTYLDWYAGGGAPYFAHEGRLFMLMKSTFALLMLGWLFVPFSWRTIRDLSREQKLTFALIAIVPVMVLGWGAISSRLFYVMTPALIVASVWGIWSLSPRALVRYSLVTLVVMSHIVWTTIQYLP